jgi:HEAT repeats
VAIALALLSCRSRETPEARIAKALASDDEEIAAAAVGETTALDPSGQERVVLRLAREISKYPFGLANASGALRRIHGVAVPTLLVLRERPGLRATADGALQHLGPQAAAAVPALEQSLDGPDPQPRIWAGAALAWIAPERIPAAIARNAEDDPGIALGLGLQLRYAPDGSAAVPGLATLLDDPRPRVRELSAAALAELGPRASPVRSALARASRDRDERVRRQAERALRAMGSGPPSAVAPSAVPVRPESVG